MQKHAMFTKVGDIVFPTSTTKPKVVISVTKFKFGSTDYFYLEMQELMGDHIVRDGWPGSNNITCLDPDEAARLYSLHKGEKPKAEVYELDLTGYQKMMLTPHVIRAGDILVNSKGVCVSVVTAVSGGQMFGHITVEHERFDTREIVRDNFVGGTQINVFRKID